MIEPEWELSEDRTTIRITFPTQPPIALELDASGVDMFLESLGTFRSVMTPGIPKGLPNGLVKSVPDPSWHVDKDALTGKVALHIRDTRYGWLHYLIPSPEAGYLSTLLDRIADDGALPTNSIN